MPTNPNAKGNKAPIQTAVTTESSLQLNPINMPLPNSCTGGPRSGSEIKIIVLHDSEIAPGSNALTTLHNVLQEQNLSVQVGIEADGTCARFCSDLVVAEQVAAFNQQALGFEQIGFASYTNWPKAQTEVAAKWIAYWANKYGIPLTHSTTHGICRHMDLGAAGGGHSDPGSGYPFTEVLKEAAGFLGKVVLGGEGEIQNGAGEVGGGTPSGISAEQAQSISKGAALAAFINLPGLLDTTESLSLKGERSLMNDKPLLGFVEQLCQGSLRNFMSMPNGNFYAFIPDYFGGLTGRQAYWEIHDVEILSGEINISDDALATHVYVVGDTGTIDQSIDVFEKVQTTGVITIFNAFMADFLNGVNDPTVTQEGKPKPTAQKQYNQEVEQVPSLAEKSKAISFLEKYGARPYFEEAPMVRSHYFETFLAYQLFCLLWSKQFLTTFEFTFMPELFPGGLVKFPEHGIQCYIDEVQHTGNYESGFQTRASLSAPTALENGNKEINGGMIRSEIFNPATVIEKSGKGKGDDGQSKQKHH